MAKVLTNMALGGFALVIILGLVVVTKTLLHTPPPFDDIAAVDIQLDEANLAANLSAAIRFKTISYQASTGKQNTEFSDFITWVIATYPEVNQVLELELLNQSMLYKWQGLDTTLKPILLTGHYDVVPVIQGQRINGNNRHFPET